MLAQDALAIPDALNQVPKEKRPKLNRALFEVYAEWYPTWTLALCCFNNTEAKRALPLLWWYEPMFPEELFLPALDSHTGDVPKLDGTVRVDHIVAFGSYRSQKDITVVFSNGGVCTRCGETIDDNLMFCPLCGTLLNGVSNPNRGEVRYTHYIPEHLSPYLLKNVIGKSYRYSMPNGDFVCSIEDVRKDIFKPERKIPSSIN